MSIGGEEDSIRLQLTSHQKNEDPQYPMAMNGQRVYPSTDSSRIGSRNGLMSLHLVLSYWEVHTPQPSPGGAISPVKTAVGRELWQYPFNATDIAILSTVVKPEERRRKTPIQLSHTTTAVPFTIGIDTDVVVAAKARA